MTMATLPVKTELATVKTGPQPKIDYELILDCVHCGLCTASCPTYVITGNEADSPRGRIYLMRQVIDQKLELDETVKGHLDTCLNCRACETACPSGVQYGKLIEPFREFLDSKEPHRAFKNLNLLQKFMMLHIFPYSWRVRVALLPARLSQWSGADWLLRKTGALKLLPKSVRSMYDMLPRLKPHGGGLPEVLFAEGTRRARVALFTGCVADGIYPETNYATAKVLQKNGCDVWIPPTQSCCGALHYHSQMEHEAKQLAGKNLTAFNRDGFKLEELDAIIINAAGCGAMVKDYVHLFQGSNREAESKLFVSKVKDITEFLVKLGPVKPTYPLRIRATYHDACHLRHAQQISSPPRQLLEMIPGLELVPLPESELCCGAAGSYNLTQPEMSEVLGHRKCDNVRSTKASAVFMGNIGCQLQIAKYLRETDPSIWVAHTIDALWASYSGEMPSELRKKS
ncbi:(Fe-S)-binding protein [Telmatocola sphagniphila]|uniref:Glycolate oxidase iron-sulfur subunit n=1 Tax=Telmatocola sphagniphila TaxID=1123043 RepID=A0A8E6B8S3_9BACT|nr:(Fe-S)-binding protein [Telmatocola sphagniphila]QVL33467.1 (Fe-S)-binding protein [Telmatocola sphagniphila]